PTVRRYTVKPSDQTYPAARALRSARLRPEMEGSCSSSKLAIAAGRCGVMRSNSSIHNGFHQVFTSAKRPRSGTRISQLRFESACGCKKLASMRSLREPDVALPYESCG